MKEYLLIEASAVRDWDATKECFLTEKELEIVIECIKITNELSKHSQKLKLFEVTNEILTKLL